MFGDLMTWTNRTQRSDHGSGKFYFESVTCPPKRTWIMSLVAHAKYERKFEMTPSGMLSIAPIEFGGLIWSVRTLATDRGFKERVREDMLVRLLDAFVWKNHGELFILPHGQRLI